VISGQRFKPRKKNMENAKKLSDKTPGEIIDEMMVPFKGIIAFDKKANQLLFPSHVRVTAPVVKGLWQNFGAQKKVASSEDEAFANALALVEGTAEVSDFGVCRTYKFMEHNGEIFLLVSPDNARFYTTEEVVIDSGTGALLDEEGYAIEEVTDEEGNPVLDEDGLPMWAREDGTPSFPQTIEKVKKERSLLAPISAFEPATDHPNFFLQGKRYTALNNALKDREEMIKASSRKEGKSSKGKRGAKPSRAMSPAAAQALARLRKKAQE